MITVDNLCYDYPDKRALEHVSLKIPAHSITALVGPNGAGKTTLMRCLAGLDSWITGDITIDDIAVEHNPRKIHDMSEYLQDLFGLYDDLTVQQSLQFIAMTRKLESNKLQSACEDAAELLGLSEYYHKKARDLSRGYRQRLAIAQTIVVRPRLLILDEPASGLDPQARHELSQLFIKLHQEGITILVSSHILAELQDYSTHMIILQNGKVLKQCALDAAALQQQTYKLILSADAGGYLAQLAELGANVLRHQQQTVWLELPTETNNQDMLKKLVNHDIPVASFSLEQESLQDIYLKLQNQQETHDA